MGAHGTLDEALKGVQAYNAPSSEDEELLDKRREARSKSSSGGKKHSKGKNKERAHKSKQKKEKELKNKDKKPKHKKHKKDKGDKSPAEASDNDGNDEEGMDQQLERGRAAVRITREILQQQPGLKQELAQKAIAVTRNPERPDFTAAQARASLERSLKALRTDRIDLWLLHEAAAADLRDDDLLRLLEDLVQQGTIGSFGVGSSADKILLLLAERAPYCRTLQYEWSILNATIPLSASFRIHHRTLTSHFRDLHAALVSKKSRCERWSEATGSDLADPETLARLMLKAALLMNPSSIILFSSKTPGHISANVQTAADAGLERAARQLYHLAQAECLPPIASNP